MVLLHPPSVDAIRLRPFRSTPVSCAIGLRRANVRAAHVRGHHLELRPPRVSPKGIGSPPGNCRISVEMVTAEIRTER
jgi:hypothetical protein